MNRTGAFLTTSLTLILAAVARAGDVGPAIEVAPKADGTRQQIWASAAWCEDAKAWLVAWREGFLNESASQIVCARIAADGQSLDPAGIAVTQGPGLKDQPRVASDGKGWLVAWEDLRNGKDWDVYAARVTGAGKALDVGGVLVAGGEGNQARPNVVFARPAGPAQVPGNYVVAWMGFTKGYGAYMVWVSPEGKLLDSPAAELAAFKNGYGSQVITPALGSNGQSILAAVVPASVQYGRAYMYVRTIDAASGQAGGPPPKTAELAGALAVIKGGGEYDQPPAVAVSDAGGLAAWSISSIKALFSVAPLAKSGAAAGAIQELGAHNLENFVPRYNLAHDGKAYLLVSDFAVATGGKRGEESVRLQIRGWSIGQDGKTSNDPKTGFEVAADAGKDQMLPFVAAGPAGKALVVYSQTRGADDVKVLARVVGAP